MTIDVERMKMRLEKKLAELETYVNDFGGMPMTSTQKVTVQDEPQELEDAAIALEAQQMENSMLANEVRILKEVQAALKRIAGGTYGRCAACGQPISEKRLEALPWASLCLQDQKRLERPQSVSPIWK